MAASPRRSAWPALALVVGSATISLGCHVHKQVRLPTGSQTAGSGPAIDISQVKVGATVRVTMKSSSTEHTFKVKEISPEALVAEDGHSYSLAEMSSLSVQALSKGRTTALVAGISIACLAVLAWAAAGVGMASLASGL
jgi:hypothetical protein